jgi:hypothetical protein
VDTSGVVTSFLSHGATWRVSTIGVTASDYVRSLSLVVKISYHALHAVAGTPPCLIVNLTTGDR